MTESRLYDLSQQLRLLARRDCRVNGNGTLVEGALDRQVEDARQELLLALELLQDGGSLDVQHLDAIRYCQALAWNMRHQVAALRREAEFEQLLEAQAPKPFRLEPA